ncbi:MAG: hypothetical protein ACRDJ5_04070 [Actinomycetota bacterium]
MDNAQEIGSYVLLAAFWAVAVIAFVRWRRDRQAQARWLFLTFADLALVTLAGKLLPAGGEDPVVGFLNTLVVAVLLVFPYLLYRVSVSFAPAPRVVDATAALATAAVVAWAFVVPDLPAEGEPSTPAFDAFVVAVVLQWVGLSAAAALRFFGGSRGEPLVARRRMRALGAASLALSAAIVISAGAGQSDNVAVQESVQLLALLAALLFMVAIAPPGWLRAAWRRPAEARLRRATVSLMEAETEDQVLERFLPHAAAVVGGKGIAVLGADGNLIGAHGIDAREASELKARADDPGAARGDAPVRLEFPLGTILVKTSSYSPFFGTDEIALLGALGVLTNLAIDRIRSHELRARLEQATMKRRQALEINDNVVQQLTVADYAFELGRDEMGRTAVKEALEGASAIISRLLEDVEGERPLTPGSLVRKEPAAAKRPTG